MFRETCNAQLKAVTKRRTSPWFYCVKPVPLQSIGYGVHTSRGVLHTPLFESPQTPNQSINSTNVLRFITRQTDKLSRNFQRTPGFNSLILKLYGGVRAYAIRPYTNSRLKKAETYARITCVYTVALVRRGRYDDIYHLENRRNNIQFPFLTKEREI